MPHCARRRLLALAVALIAMSSGGCVAHEHRVGTGPAGVGSISVRQYYIFFGLFELNEVDSQRFAEESVSYDIHTEMSFVDLLISVVLSPLTVTTRTVTVER